MEVVHNKMLHGYCIFHDTLMTYLYCLITFNENMYRKIIT